MFHFPLFRWPEWMPWIGGDVFFSPIFNFADASISCGIISLILFYNKIISKIGFFKDAAEEDSVQEDSNKNN